MIVGNWKMNKTAKDVEEFFAGLRQEKVSQRNWGIAAAFPLLPVVQSFEKEFGFFTCAQNVHEEPSGAFTGEVSWPMLENLSWTLLGHSERRTYFGDTDIRLKKKLLSAKGKNVIFCIGETWAEREKNLTELTLARQLDVALEKTDHLASLVIAYEPVWAIGTGKASTPEDAADVHRFIRGHLEARSLKNIKILYGGSVTPQNVASLFAKPEIDGALVGGASLKPQDFAKLLVHAK